jgi:polyhydroxyalkanoate synthesis regulator phasin
MVPRSAIHSLDERLRAIESAVREAEEEQWRRTDPQARRRAQDTVDMFTSQIDKLARQADAADKKGDAKRAATLRESIKTYSLWRDQAAKALEDFRA